jgi:tetratricopeptide (TPR) repeat protein
MSTNRPGKNKSPEQKQAALSELIDEFTKAIKSNPKDASAFLSRGIAYHQQGNHDQAARDFTKAIRLKPEYASDETVKSYLDAALSDSIANFNRKTIPVGDSLNKIPDAALVDTLPSFLDASDLNSLSQTSGKNTRLFKPVLALKKLLHLVVRYELDEDKIKEAIANGVNPILQEVNALLTQDSSLALKRNHTTDHSGRKRYWSPLEAAYWSGNWELCNMMIKHISSGEMSATAEEQLREWDQQAYHYDLILMRAEAGASPDLEKLEKKPALIKQYNEDGKDKIFQWGDVNGEWHLTELEGDTKQLFANLDFPNTSSNKPITMTSDQITKDMYDALKKGHTVAHFDLDEYVRVTTVFVNKYPVNVPVP